jgi:hypothetical protein
MKGASMGKPERDPPTIGCPSAGGTVSRTFTAKGTMDKGLTVTVWLEDRDGNTHSPSAITISPMQGAWSATFEIISPGEYSLCVQDSEGQKYCETITASSSRSGPKKGKFFDVPTITSPPSGGTVCPPFTAKGRMDIGLTASAFLVDGSGDNLYPNAAACSPFTGTWSATFDSVPNGSYNLCVQDSDGQKHCEPITISCNGALSKMGKYDVPGISSPSSGGSVSSTFSANGTMDKGLGVTVWLVDGDGHTYPPAATLCSPLTGTWSATFQGIPPGSYSLCVKDSDGQKHCEPITVT